MRFCTFFVLMFGIVNISAQKVTLDKKFGKNGRLEIKSGNFHELFYELNDKYMYLTYIDRKVDNFSRGFSYLFDGVIKIDVNSGKHATGFGKRGKVEHKINTNDFATCGQYWDSANNKIIAMNLYAKNKDILIFDKEDGSLITFPKPKNRHHCFFFDFLFYDEENNRFLTNTYTELFWVDSAGQEVSLNLKDIVGPNATSLLFSSVNTASDSAMVLIRELPPILDSTVVNCKLVSVKGNKLSLKKSFSCPFNTRYNKWDRSRSALISMSKETLACNLDILDDSSAWYKENISNLDSIGYNFINELDSILYGRSSISTYYSSDEDSSIKSMKDIEYSIDKISLATNHVVRYPLLEALPSGLLIHKIIHIKSNEFVILARDFKGSDKSYLYKVNLN